MVQRRKHLVQQVHLGAPHQEFTAGLSRTRKTNFKSRRQEEAEPTFGVLFGDHFGNGLCRKFIRLDKVNEAFKERNNVAGLWRHIQCHHGGLAATAIGFRNLLPAKIVIRNRVGQFLRNRNHTHKGALVLDRIPTRYGSRSAQGVLQRSFLHQRILESVAF